MVGFNSGQWLVDLVVEGGAWRCELEIWVFLLQSVQFVGFFFFFFFTAIWVDLILPYW